MLAVERVRKDFGEIHAVRDVSFQIPAGSTFGLIGPNGAGKTTTMRMILNILIPDGGRITWNGATIDTRLRRTFGYLPEERGLYGKMKVREHIAYFARLRGLGDPEVTQRTNAWIERLGLAQYADRPCAELSKGNQQKVQIACAAVHEPTLLVLDEPFSGLDPVNADILFAVFAEMRSRGTTLVLSSHQMWQLESLCDTFCIITGGENRAMGTLAELRAEWPTRVLRVSPASAATAAVLEGVPNARRLGSEQGAVDYEIPAATSLPDTLRALVAVEAVTRFEAIEPTLHDIYLHAIGAA
ncbi:MAG: ATP-binding cassette domain-containing protein [Candidatus Eremiobacteraeota bacterium]|nr:ATP-binding cassette domain-containing protein [Candidatus Eremiobacteraeota bacterium]